MNDLGDAERFIYPLAIGSNMDHVGLDAKDGQQDKCEIIVRRNEDLRTRIARVFRNRTRGIYAGRSHLRPGEVVLVRTNRDIQIVVGGLRKAFIIVEANDHPFGLVEDGW